MSLTLDDIKAPDGCWYISQFDCKVTRKGRQITFVWHDAFDALDEDRIEYMNHLAPHGYKIIKMCIDRELDFWTESMDVILTMVIETSPSPNPPKRRKSCGDIDMRSPGLFKPLVNDL